MAVKETTLEEIGETLGHVVKHMATRDDLKDLATKVDLATFREEVSENFRELRAEIADIRSDLDDLREKFENVAGYRKEIDHALERIARIEKHVGIASHV